MWDVNLAFQVKVHFYQPYINRSRFAFIEEQAIKQQRTLEDMTLSEMDELWNQAKRQLKSGEKPHAIQHEILEK